MNESYILELHNICKSFPGVRALDNVSLKVKRGSVYAIVGENGAGKSTLMNILSGLYKPDSGTIIYDGQKVTNFDTGKAMKMGINMIHQELHLVSMLSVAENIFLGRYPMQNNRFFIDRQKMNEQTDKYLEEWGMKFKSTTLLRDLTIANYQIIEIIKAISRKSKLIIMDEPTSALSETEADKLFEIVRRLKEKGISFIFISHRLEELFKIAEEVSVLRDGYLVGHGIISEMTRDKIIQMMVGRKLGQIYPKEEVTIGEVVLEVKGLTRQSVFENINFSVRRGEIFGLSGLMGAGRTEIARAIFGLDKLDCGEIFVENKPLKIKSVQDAIASGIAMVSEDRKTYGLVLCRSILENTSLVALKNFVKHKIINKKREKDKIQSIIEILSVKLHHLNDMANSLSGGNQQKVVLAKWLINKPKVIILDEPTRGIDVGSKSEIYKLMCKFADEGMSIILISSELPEIIGMADRIAVINTGRIAGILERKEATQERIMELAT